MEFLEQLYSHEDFGIYLFALIAILVIAFFIILFFGKKEEKNLNEEMPEKDEFKNLEENTSVMEEVIPVNNVEESMSNTLEENVITNEEIKAEEIDNKVDFDSLVSETPVLKGFENETFSFEEVKEEPIHLELDEKNIVSNVVLNDDIEKESDDILRKEFDFDALADAISKELDSLNNRESKNEAKKIIKEEIVEKEEIKPVIEEEKFVFPNFEPVTPDEFPIELNNNHEQEKEIPKQEEIKVRPVMPNVFSSVYVNRENETTKNENEPIKIEKPKFELPKKVELPKKAEPVIKEEKEVFSFENIIEENTDSYDI